MPKLALSWQYVTFVYSGRQNISLRIFCGILGNIAISSTFQCSQSNILTFSRWLSKFSIDFSVDFDFLKFYEVSVLRKFSSFFQNRQYKILQFLRHFQNLTLKPNISKTSCPFDLRFFSLIDRSLLPKHDFSHNFWLPSFSGNALNTSLTEVPR